MTTLEQTKELLAQLESLQAELEKRQAEYDSRKAEILAPIQPQLDDLQAEYAPSLQTVQEGLETLSGMIKANIINLGYSVKHGTVQAVYSNGRVSWDDGALQGFCLSYPKLMQFRSVGNPSVAIKRVKTKE